MWDWHTIEQQNVLNTKVDFFYLDSQFHVLQVLATRRNTFSWFFSAFIFLFFSTKKEFFLFENEWYFLPHYTYLTSSFLQHRPSIAQNDDDEFIANGNIIILTLGF
jgi:hypothetical protein